MSRYMVHREYDPEEREVLESAPLAKRGRYEDHYGHQYLPARMLDDDVRDKREARRPEYGAEYSHESLSHEASSLSYGKDSDLLYERVPTREAGHSYGLQSGGSYGRRQLVRDRSRSPVMGSVQRYERYREDDTIGGAALSSAVLSKPTSMNEQVENLLARVKWERIKAGDTGLHSSTLVRARSNLITDDGSFANRMGGPGVSVHRETLDRDSDFHSLSSRSSRIDRRDIDPIRDMRLLQRDQPLYEADTRGSSYGKGPSYTQPSKGRSEADTRGSSYGKGPSYTQPSKGRSEDRQQFDEKPQPKAKYVDPFLEFHSQYKIQSTPYNFDDQFGQHTSSQSFPRARMHDNWADPGGFTQTPQTAGRGWASRARGSRGRGVQSQTGGTRGFGSRGRGGGNFVSMGKASRGGGAKGFGQNPATRGRGAKAPNRGGGKASAAAVAPNPQKKKPPEVPLPSVVNEFPVEERFQNLCRMAKELEPDEDHSNKLEHLLAHESVCMAASYVFNAEPREDSLKPPLTCRVFIEDLFIASATADVKSLARAEAQASALKVLATKDPEELISSHERLHVLGLTRKEADSVEMTVRFHKKPGGLLCPVPEEDIVWKIGPDTLTGDIEFFVLEPEFPTGQTDGSILRQSAEFSHVLLKIQCCKLTSTIACMVNVEGRAISRAVCHELLKAKEVATSVALRRLREKFWTIQIIHRDKWANVNTELTKDLVSIDPEDPETMKACQEQLGARLKKHLDGLEDQTQWVTLEMEGTKEQRAILLPNIAKELNLRVEWRVSSKNKGMTPRLIVSKRFTGQDLFDYIWEKGGTTWRFKLKPPATFKVPSGKK